MAAPAHPLNRVLQGSGCAVLRAPWVRRDRQALRGMLLSLLQAEEVLSMLRTAEGEGSAAV